MFDGEWTYFFKNIFWQTLIQNLTQDPNSRPNPKSIWSFVGISLTRSLAHDNFFIKSSSILKSSSYYWKFKLCCLGNIVIFVIVDLIKFEILIGEEIRKRKSVIITTVWKNWNFWFFLELWYARSSTIVICMIFSLISVFQLYFIFTYI